VPFTQGAPAPQKRFKLLPSSSRRPNPLPARSASCSSRPRCCSPRLAWQQPPQIHLLQQFERRRIELKQQRPLEDVDIPVVCGHGYPHRHCRPHGGSNSGRRGRSLSQRPFDSEGGRCNHRNRYGHPGTRNFRPSPSHCHSLPFHFPFSDVSQTGKVSPFSP